MSEVIILGALVAILFLACLPALRHAASGRGLHWFAVMTLARLLALTWLAAVAWKAFWGRDVRAHRSLEEELPAIIVLEDRSGSMEVRGSDGRTRADLASRARARLEAIANEQPAGRRSTIEHLVFAENVVPAGETDRLLTSGSRIHHALASVLARHAPRAVLLLSDGASTDGPAAPWVLDQARNRDIRIHAICTAEPAYLFCDRILTRVEGESEHPTRIRAVARSQGQSRDPLDLVLRVDGRPAGRVRRPAAAEQEVALRLPPTTGGWHAYSVEIEPRLDEATRENNTAWGVYRGDEEREILLVTSRPRLETALLARRWKERYGARLRVSSVRELAGDPTTAGSPAVVVLADVDPASLPDVLRDPWLSGWTPLLLLGGDYTRAWREAAGPAFPLRGVDDAELLGDPEALVRRSPSPAVARALRGGDVELPIDLVISARTAPGSTTLYRAETNAGSRPLLVADSLAEPRWLVVLTDTTWKWALCPWSDVRSGYEVIWSTCLDWLVRHAPDGSPLRLEIEPRDDEDAEVRGRVRSAARPGDAAIESCRVTITRDGKPDDSPVEVTVEPGATGATFRLTLDPRTSEPGVLWLEARATVDGHPVVSERVPVVWQPSRRETLDVRPREDLLARCTTGEAGSLAWHDRSDETIRALLDDAPAPPSVHRTESRDPSAELLLALLGFACLAAEWWVERRMRSEAS